MKDISEYKWSSYLEYVGRSKVIDKDFILDIINTNRNKAILIFKEFHNRESSSETYLDIQENKRLKDSKAVGIIKDVCNISHCMDLQKLELEKRNKYLKILKEEGLSTRQISRLTGISRNVVLKA